MNQLVKFFFIILLYNVILYGSIDDEIEAIQQATVEQRFKLMNELKKKIVQMKEDKRMKSIKKLQQATNGELILDKNSSSNIYKKIENRTQDILDNRVDTGVEEHNGEEND